MGEPGKLPVLHTGYFVKRAENFNTQPNAMGKPALVDAGGVAP